MRALVTGASGYVGTRLVPALARAGFDVVATARHPDRLAAVDWHDDVEVTGLDVLDPASCAAALDGPHVDVAYYLVHAIGEGDFAARDREGAHTFGTAARAAGVGRVVYLGGFVPDGESLSAHLDSRAETAEVLARCGVPLVWLRAAVVIGAGSTSFEIIRTLGDRLPVLPTPSWMERLVQPIAVDDVLHYLVAAADPALPPGGYDIAGEEVMPYRDLLRRYLAAAGLRRRLLVRTPGVAPALAAAVIGRVTPVPAGLTADLVDSLSNTMVSEEARIRTLVPDPPGGLTGVDDAMRRALRDSPDGTAGERPGPAAASDPLTLLDTDPDWAGADRLGWSGSRAVRAPAATVWDRIEGIGAADGYVGWPATWRLRGVGARLATGRGLRTRSGPLVPGQRLDFTTVDGLEEGHYLRLATTALAAGRGTLELRVEPDPADADDRCTLHLRVRWTPRGLTGRAAWWALRPTLGVDLARLLRRLARDAEARVARAV